METKDPIQRFNELKLHFGKSQKQNERLKKWILFYSMYSFTLAFVAVLSIDRAYPAILFMILAAFVAGYTRRDLYEPGKVVVEYQNVPSENFDISIVTSQYYFEILASQYIGTGLNAYRGFVATIIALQSSYILATYLLGR